MKKILLLMILCLCLPFVFGEQQSLGYYKQNECVDLIQNCADCSYINITSLKYPNSSIAISNVEMQKDGSLYNYTFCDTTAIGQYIVNGVGDVGGTATVFAYDFRINSLGNEEESNSMLVVYLVIIGAIFVYLISSFLMDNVHIIPKLVTFFMAFINTAVALLMVYIERVSPSMTNKMLLYLFEGNIFVVLILIGYYFIYLTKKASPMGDEKDDYL